MTNSEEDSRRYFVKDEPIATDLEYPSVKPSSLQAHDFRIRSEYEGQTRQWKERYEQTLAENEVLSKKLTGVQRKHSVLSKQIRSDRVTESLQYENSSLKSTFRSLGKKLRTTTAELEETQSALEFMVSTCKTQSETIFQLQQTLEKQRQEIQKLQKETQNYTPQQEQWKNRFEEKSRECAELQRNFNTMALQVTNQCKVIEDIRSGLRDRNDKNMDTEADMVYL